MAENTAGIGEAARILRRGGIEKNSNGLLGLRAKDNHAGKKFSWLARFSIDVKNAVRTIVGGIHQDLVDHGIRNERAVAGGECVRNRGERGIEIRMRHAPAFAWTAEVARAAAIERTREVGAARGGDGAAKFFSYAFAKKSFLAGQRNGRLKKAVGKMLDRFFHAGDANVSLHEIVIGLNVFVRERPVLAVAIARSSLKVPIAKAQAYAAPDVGAAARDAQTAHPKERLISGCGVRLFEVVDEPIVVVLAANFEDGLDGARIANDFRSHVAVLKFEGRLV